MLTLLLPLLLRLGVEVMANSSPPGANGSFELNAIAGVDGNSTVECWTLTLGNAIAAGTIVQQLGGIENATYSSFPHGAPIDAGTHTAPNLQYFMIIRGGATITFPAHSEQLLRIEAGQMYIAADSPSTSHMGHHTVVDGGSLILQLPFTDGMVPPHTTVRSACAGENFWAF